MLNRITTVSYTHLDVYKRQMSDGRTIRVDWGFLWSVVTSEGVKNMESNLASLREWMQVRIDDINVCLLYTSRCV